MAPGMSGILAGVPLCGEAQANAGTCSPASQIGETIVSVGLGGDPFTVTGGKVYLTEKDQGAPFGLSIVNPADAGPFHLGKVVVRASIQVDPTTAQLTITNRSDPAHHQGLPAADQARQRAHQPPRVHVQPDQLQPDEHHRHDRERRRSILPRLGPVPGHQLRDARLQAGLQKSQSRQDQQSERRGALGQIGLSQGPVWQPGQHRKVKVELPVQLPSRLTTLQKACLSATFAANPANCPGSSIVGHAKVITPLLPVPLEGPAYFVSHGGEAFPSLTIVLKGYGVTVDLVGTTFINPKGIHVDDVQEHPRRPL